MNALERPLSPDRAETLTELSTKPFLQGFTDQRSTYSPRHALHHHSALVRPLVAYSPQTLWAEDTRSLPRALASYRRQVREFAEQQLRPLAEQLDLQPHSPLGQPNPIRDNLLVLAGQQGYLSDLLPSPFGSTPWLRYRYPLAWQQAIKVEEFARVCGGLMLLLSAHNLGAAPLLLSGDMRAARRFLLPAFKESQAGNPHLFAYAITEPAAGSDVEESHGASLCTPGVIAQKVPGGWRLRGRKCFISGGDLAQSITVFGALEGEGIDSWTCFLVHNTQPGFRVARTELKMGMRASGAAELEFDDVFVPNEQVIGGLRRGWAINRAILNLSRLPVAAMAVGFAQAATDLAMDFACQYRVNGEPLINHQETQLQIAQMVAETSTIRALVWKHANAWTITQRKSAMAKFHCSDTAVRVCEQAMELMGNHGGLYTRKVEKVFRDARLTQIFEGTNQINRLALIEDIQEELIQKMSPYR